LLLALTALSLDVVRSSSARARSARAAAVGSSLALRTRLPLVICSCVAVRLSWRDIRLLSALSYALAVEMRWTDIVVAYQCEAICSSVSKIACATCSTLAAAW
jgi:hypothetical protein